VEWFTIMVINFVCICALFGFNLAEYFDFKRNLIFANNTLVVNFPNSTSCKVLFQFNLWASLINSVCITCIGVTQMIVIFFTFYRLFIGKEDDNIAITSDKDIVVYTT